MPKLYTLWSLDKYDGSTDRDAHIKSYRDVMLYAEESDEVMCRAFPSTHKRNFASKMMRRTTHYLKNVVQDKDVSLKNFLSSVHQGMQLKHEVAMNYLDEMYKTTSGMNITRWEVWKMRVFGECLRSNHFLNLLPSTVALTVSITDVLTSIARLSYTSVVPLKKCTRRTSASPCRWTEILATCILSLLRISSSGYLTVSRTIDLRLRSLLLLCRSHHMVVRHRSGRS
ncbi:11-oxo-beta-amyrin 30-oxidase-like [Senna tora]|uniref:11-oxo-beta-amyrin 30-oxidase-like n=1 Tax=Senna tora TaxID=362788 RepID=A0A834WPR5_9FABA|nr:11-oxo-beta-amyrin 30-oxidase-like [Senna tora]